MREQHSQRRKGQLPDHDSIMNSIASAIEKMGLDHCTMDDFARAAGMSRISLYRLYGNKLCLIDAVLAHRAGQFNAAMRSKMQQIYSLEDALMLYFSETVRLAKRDQTIRQFVDRHYVFRAVYQIENNNMQEHVGALWRPILKRFCHTDAAILQLDERAVVNWLLVMQATLSRVAIESDFDEHEINSMVKDFISPAFFIGQRDAKPLTTATIPA